MLHTNIPDYEDKDLNFVFGEWNLYPFGGTLERDLDACRMYRFFDYMGCSHKREYNYIGKLYAIFGFNSNSTSPYTTVVPLGHITDSPFLPSRWMKNGRFSLICVEITFKNTPATIYHNTGCFQCATCKVTLTMITFAALDGYTSVMII